MTIRNTTLWLGLFFMFVGSVCVDSAIGAEPANEADNTSAELSGSAIAPAGPPEDAPEAGNAGAGKQAAGQSESNGDGNGDGESGDMFSNDPAGQDVAQQPGQQADQANQDTTQPASDTGKPDLPAGQQVNVGSFGQIDLHVKDLELTKVLQLLSIQSKRNIVANRNVSGKISADLYDVGFYEALDAILHTNGFGYKEKGNFIYVYTQAQMEQMDKADRNIESRVVRLNYLTAQDASTFVSPMLSAPGSIAVSGAPEAGMEPTLNDAGANSFVHAATLVIHDYPEKIEEIVQVLEQLDHRPKQVRIEATVLEARLSEANAFGVDFALFADLEADDFTTPLGSVGDMLSGTGRDDQVLDSGSSIASTPGQTDAGQSSVKLGFMGSDAALFVKALDSVTDTTVVASPEITALNRQRSKLHVGQKLGYLSTTNTETSSTQTVEFLEIGTELTVRPFVGDDGYVRLELNSSVSDGETRLVGGFVIPNETTQQVTTNVLIESGQTIVLGGLFKEDTSIGRRQVPGLAGIPVVGEAFKGQDDEVQRTEVIFLIKPTIMKDEKLYARGDDALKGIQQQRVGAREGQLPWARAKLTNSHLTKAYEYQREGNISKALWHTNLALEANPTMVEALRLKEELSGEELMVRDYSILESAVNNMVDDAAPNQKQDEGSDASDDAGEAEGADDAADAGGQRGQPEPEAAADKQAEPSASESTDDASSNEDANREAAMQSVMDEMLEEEANGASEGKAAEQKAADDKAVDEKTADETSGDDAVEVTPAIDGPK